MKPSVVPFPPSAAQHKQYVCPPPPPPSNAARVHVDVCTSILLGSFLLFLLTCLEKLEAVYISARKLPMVRLLLFAGTVQQHETTFVNHK